MSLVPLFKKNPLNWILCFQLMGVIGICSERAAGKVRKMKDDKEMVWGEECALRTDGQAPVLSSLSSEITTVGKRFSSFTEGCN